MTREDVLVVIPAFNEAATIGEVIAAVQAQGYDRIAVVDDGSSDSTSLEAGRAGATVIRHVINRGPGAATQTGLAFARRTHARCLVTLDADRQHDAHDIHGLLEAMEAQSADVVIGNRFLKGTNFIPRSRVIFNALANLVTYVFSAHWVSDTQSGYKLFSRKAIQNLQIEMDGFAFCSEIIIKAQRAKLRIVEVPIRVEYSTDTIKKGQGLRTGIRTLTHLVQGYIFK
jgi:glycosyltransferase involved in cell wall biosynthesis